MIQMWLICLSGMTAYLWLMYGTTALKKSCEWEYGALNQAQGAGVVKNLTACLVPSVPLTCKSQLASLLVSRVWLDLWFWSFDFVYDRSYCHSVDDFELISLLLSLTAPLKQARNIILSFFKNVNRCHSLRWPIIYIILLFQQGWV